MSGSEHETIVAPPPIIATTRKPDLNSHHLEIPRLKQIESDRRNWLTKSPTPPEAFGEWSVNVNELSRVEHRQTNVCQRSGGMAINPRWQRNG